MRQFSKKRFSAKKKLVKISDQARFKSRPDYFGFQFQDSQIIVHLDKNVFPSKQKKNLIKFLIVQEKMLLYPTKFKFSF